MSSEGVRDTVTMYTQCTIDKRDSERFDATTFAAFAALPAQVLLREALAYTN